MAAKLALEGEPSPGHSLGNLEMPYHSADGLDYDEIGAALRASLDAYKVGVDLDRPVTSWFRDTALGATVPPPSIPPDYIRSLQVMR